MAKNKQIKRAAADDDERSALAASDDTLRQEIALRAYYRHCERGWAPGADMDDWLAAEREVREELAAHTRQRKTR